VVGIWGYSHGSEPEENVGHRYVSAQCTNGSRSLVLSRCLPFLQRSEVGRSALQCTAPAMLHALLSQAASTWSFHHLCDSALQFIPRYCSPSRCTLSSSGHSPSVTLSFDCVPHSPSHNLSLKWFMDPPPALKAGAKNQVLGVDRPLSFTRSGIG
jgi:hypothetical protein